MVCIPQDGSFVPLVLEGKTIRSYPGHTCLTTREVSVCCVDENGTLKVNSQFRNLTQRSALLNTCKHSRADGARGTGAALVTP